MTVQGGLCQTCLGTKLLVFSCTGSVKRLMQLVDNFHLCFQYISGGDLEQLLADENIELPWTIRVKIASDIAVGMAYLHSRGFMHRDLTSKVWYKVGCIHQMEYI